MKIESTAFAPGGEIPVKYTCKGDDVSPPLSWSGVPANARSLVLIVDDPDAPDPAAPKRTWVHWVVHGLAPASTGLPEAAGSSPPPAPAKAGLNDWSRPTYSGPCPPIGRHRYFFKLYALDIELPAMESATKPALESAMQGHTIAHAELIGTFQK
ncbi:MAG TPA: YbhB/YbcL family Raf kinase inhibitor-like protein [Candidatus Limnocylindrales bacterium]|nr:YbhB/YbcL family Raf kinase inhibitor-like protein [Candidatus Limnocylindrales bacterium]